MARGPGGGSSTSRTTPSPRSPRSQKASSTFASAGSGGRTGLTPATLRELAARHGIRPKKSLGQHFLIEPGLARRIAALAGVGPGSRVLEIGAGLGSLTLALAETGADVVAVEVDRNLLPALEEVLAGRDNVRVRHADALTADWGVLLTDPGPWILVANLPYNVAVLVVLGVLEREPRVERLLVMVQREVGERLVAPPGGSAFGGVTLRVAYRADAEVLRRVPPSVFWPRPGVDSVLVQLTRRPPPVSVVESDLWPVVDEAFAQRRKTMRNALVRLGLDRGEAVAVLQACGVDPSTRPERLGLKAFACLAERVAAALGSGSTQADEPL